MTIAHPILAAFFVGVASMLAGGVPAQSRPAATPADYPSCGSYWNRNTPVTPRERRVTRCIVRAAREGRRARAVATLTTIEGDPIVNYVFVHGGGRNVLVVVDSRRDAYGARVWSRFSCKRLGMVDGRLAWTGCRLAGTGKPSWLVPIRLPR